MTFISACKYNQLFDQFILNSMKPAANSPTSYEKEVRLEIEQWKNEKEGLMSNALNTVSAPISWAFNKVIPDNLNEPLEKAVISSFGVLNNAARWTYSDAQIVKSANALGMSISHYTELGEYDLKKLDQLARQCFLENRLAAALEGAGCGLGGLTMIAADIPLLFTISFRAVQQIGSSYGFQMDDPDMMLIVMNIFNAGAAGSSTAKAAAIADMHIAAEAFKRGGKIWTYHKISNMTSTGVIAKLLKDRAKYLPKEIAKQITKRKLGQAIPIVGAAVGGGFNYWFLHSTTKTAYMIFRDMYLTDKYG